MATQLFRTKSLDVLVSEAEVPQHQLKRTLGAFDVIMLGIGAIVGAGIFATIGTATAGDPSWNYMHPENWRPFAPNGWAGVQAGAAIVFFAYIGFDDDRKYSVSR